MTNRTTKPTIEPTNDKQTTEQQLNQLMNDNHTSKQINDQPLFSIKYCVSAHKHILWVSHGKEKRKKSTKTTAGH